MDDSKINVLIVDDTRTIRFQLKTILRSNKYNVVEADSGAAALEQIDASVPDVILMDVMMPNMNGIECCKLIKENPKHQDIRIIMVTGAKEYALISDAYRSGCNDYVTKPIDGDKLIEKIDKAVRLFRIIRDTRSTLPADFVTGQN